MDAVFVNSTFRSGIRMLTTAVVPLNLAQAYYRINSWSDCWKNTYGDKKHKHRAISPYRALSGRRASRRKPSKNGPGSLLALHGYSSWQTKRHQSKMSLHQNSRMLPASWYSAKSVLYLHHPYAEGNHAKKDPLSLCPRSPGGSDSSLVQARAYGQAAQEW